MKALMIGCGGIGSWLCHFMAFGRRNYVLPMDMEITIADPDVVEAKNLLYSNFEVEDMNKNKAEVLAKRYCYKALPKAMESSQYLQGFDIIMVATDNAKSRKLVQESGKPWVDMRCKGQLWMVFSSRTPSLSKKGSIREEDLSVEGQSCQLSGDFSTKNVKFGCLVAASAGFQEMLNVIRAPRSERYV